MNELYGKIGIIPLFCLMILAVGLMNHVLVIPQLLQAAYRDSWLSVIFTVIPYLAWSWLLLLIMRRSNYEPFIPWLKQRYGAFIATVIRWYFIVYLFMIAVVTVVETTGWTKISYLNRTPIFFIVGSMTLVCFFSARWGIRAIAISSGMLLPLVIIFGDFVMSANLPKKEYSLLFPIFENGLAPVMHGALYVGGGLVELIILLLMQHRLKSKIRLWSIWLLAIFLIILTLGPVTGAIAEFGPFEAAELRYPAYEEWRLVSIGRYIQHVDFLSIYQWLSGAVIRISIAIYLIADLTRSEKHRKPNPSLLKVGIISLLITLISIMPISDNQYFNFMRHIYFPVSFISANIILCTLLILVFMMKPKTGAPTEVKP